MERKQGHLFVAVNQPNGSPDARSRKFVRSFITTLQHDRRRGGRRRAKSELHQIRLRPCRTYSAVDSSLDDGLCVASKTTERYALAAGRRPELDALCVEERQRNSDVPCPESLLDPALAESPLDPPSPTDLLSSRLEDPSDPLSIYARQLGTDAAELWSHYLIQERQHGANFRRQFGSFPDTKKCLHPLILSCPTMLTSTVLFTGCFMRYRRKQTIMSPIMLHMQSLAYGYVQLAIDSEERLSDATFLAVIKLALFEVFFGREAAYHAHMQGIAQMIRLRQGLQNLGSGGYVASILVWFDAHLSAITGSPRYLAEEASLASIKDIEADETAFALGIERSAF